MALETTLRELSDGLKAARITERKRNADNLKEFLTRNAVPSLLTANTLQKKGYTWNDLFEDIHEYVLKETEKFETSKSFDSVTAPLCTSLLQLCVAGSNKGQAYIKCDKVTEACLHILQDSRLKKAIGDAYLNVLSKHVLPHEHYQGFITPTAWENILDVCLSACFENYSKLDDFTKLRLVLLVIKSATSNCQFIIPLRDSLSMLKKYFLRILNDKKTQEVVVETIILILEVLSGECRLTVLNFVESIFPAILKIYEQNLDQKKKSLLFKLLYAAVVLHHPHGRTSSEEGSLANNWNVWNKHLYSISEIICLEVACLQKIRKLNDCLLKQCKYFCCLAASVYFQIFSQSETIENEAANSSKRQKLSFNKNKTFNDLIDELRQNHVPWLGVVHVFVQNHGHTISTDDFLLLINVISTLVTNNSIMNWDTFEELTCTVLSNLKSHLNPRKDECDNTLLSLWNSCVRNCTTLNSSHKALHKIMRFLLTFDIIIYQNAQPLIKLYFDKGMPVTDSSVKTLNEVFLKFYSKCSYDDIRLKCFVWLIQGDITVIDAKNAKELILRFNSNENINFLQAGKASPEHANLYDILFNSPESCILFSQFELEISKDATIREDVSRNVEINFELEKHVLEYFRGKLANCIDKQQSDYTELLGYIKLTNIVCEYFDCLLKYTCIKDEQIKDMETYCLLKTVLKQINISLKLVLKSNALMAGKINLLESLKELMVADFEPLISTEVRVCIEKEFFLCINNILINETKMDDDDILYEGDAKEMNVKTLRHNCILVLAAYCRKNVNYREELLDLILDPKLYNFTYDLQCAFQCIELLNDSTVEQPPLESIFTLLRHMCKDLYRDSKASYGILRILIRMLDSIWSNDSTMKQNCFIMAKGYLQRCEKMHYPPKVAALIYECVAKIATLNHMQNCHVDDTFEVTLIGKIKGDIHNVRIYCCYLLKPIINYFSEDDIESLLTRLQDIFLINVSERKELVLKDESANRTLTVLHCFLALAQTKNSLIQKTVTGILELHKEKSLDKNYVKKVLNIIVNIVGIKNVDIYVNNNILSVLYFWFLKKYNVDDFPVYLFGNENSDMFIEKHKKWLISADILWRKGGDLKDSEVLKKIKAKPEQTVENIIETCFCNILVLCLPYIVTDKYKLDYRGSENPVAFKQSMENSDKMFRLTGQILKNEKWTNLFVENVGELVLLIARHLCDHKNAKQLFQVNIPEKTRTYYYPKNVFSAILNYFGELTDGNIMHYLCENQPLAIFQVLFSLWESVLQENVFECRVLALHAFVTFIEHIPLGFSSDAFVCNYACKCFANVIKACKTTDDMKIYGKGLKIVLERFLPDKADLIKKSVSQLLAILVIKKEEGYENECTQLLNYLNEDMKVYLNENVDVPDYVRSLSQGIVGRVNCLTSDIFLAKLKSFKLRLTCPSPETLISLQNFLKVNKQFRNAFCKEMNPKGFSEACGSSIIHQVVHSLNNILKSTHFDEKTKIEACNCLSQIGTYDLKTLVTVPPADTHKIVTLEPKFYFASVAMKSLSEVLFDEDPAVTGKVADTLNSLLKFQEGNDSIDSAAVDMNILLPFSSANHNASGNVKINNRNIDQTCIEFPDGIFIRHLVTSWISNDNKNHGDWLKRVTSALLHLIDSTSYLDSLLEVCVLKSSVCRSILPALVGLILHYSSLRHIEIIGKHINNFFHYIWEQTFDDKDDNTGDSYNPRLTNILDRGQKMVVQYMLDIVNFVRLQRHYYKLRTDRTVETLNYLNLEYDKVAWAATVADQNLAAIYYGEMWAVSRNDGVPPSSPESTTHIEGAGNVQRIFRKCYVSIGEMDAIEGCGTAHLTIEEEKRKHLMNCGQHADALVSHDIALSSDTSARARRGLQCGAVAALHYSGMHHLALHYIKSLTENDHLNDIKYECLSFLGDWSEIVDTRDLEEKSKLTTCNPSSIIKAFHYACLKDCLNIQTTQNSENKLALPLSRAKLAVAKLCQNLNMENCQSVYKVVAKLHLFTDIEDYFSVRTNKLPIGELLSSWDVDRLPSFNDFRHLESLISQRVLILEHAAKSYSSLLSEIVSLQIQYANLGLSNHRVQMSQRLLAVVKKLQTSEEIALVESEISWAKGHKEIALSLLRNIVSDQSTNVKLTAISLRQYALWMAESKRDNARDIINKYLLKSIEVLKKRDHVETRLKVYHDIARFADTEYKQVVAYINSSEFDNKVKCIESMKGTASSLRSTQKSLNRDERKALYTNQRFLELDEAEISNTMIEKESFLHLAIRYYLLSLKQCEENNLSVFRVISLWLDNPNFELDPVEDGSFEDLLHAIPSRKFITVLPQLAPRLANEDSAFANNLKKIIKRCAMEHPHHTLPILFSLKNSDKDRVILNASGGVGGGGGGGSTPCASRRAAEQRVLAAEGLVTQLANEDNDIKLIISQMEKMCDATISFANFKPTSKLQKQKIPAAENIHKLSRLHAIPIPTVTIPIKNDCKYDCIPSLASFANYFELVGGINCPKKISCTDSRGRTRILLIKGEDDLRQDAVMQQVFTIVNTLLEKNPVTSRNKLLIRTYKVVPMSRQSGVLEWCEGTIPLGGYLVGIGGDKVGAHSRYRPKDITCAAARKKLTECYETRKNNKEKLIVFKKILSEFRPVFHYFFTEHYLDPVTWYERRLAYTKSVAASSMMGYIMGLGDRHVQNILIDKMTAEVIHIDFGIAFDQGKTLHTPETVPFRLTQDMVAGFGSSGVEGIFRRCCEKTMQLLRDNQETLLTILEVLLCDPLYSWTVTSGQQNIAAASTSVHGTAGSNSGLAERALLAVSSKLGGTEGGVAGGVSVPGQVARLLHTATDPVNLCRLFPGWQPYL